MKTYILFDSPLAKQPLYIITDDDVFAALLWEGYAPFVNMSVGGHIHEKNIKSLFVRKEGELRWLSTDVNSEGKLVNPAILSHLLFLFVSKNLVLKDYIYFMHGAIISYNHRGIILTGESGAGKSTLCAFLKLAKEPFICATDDKSLIDCESLKTFPAGDGIHLREDSLKVLHTYYENLNEQSVSLYRYKRAKLKADETEEGLLAAVVQIERTEGENSCNCLDAQGAVKTLLMNGFISSNIGKNVGAVLALCKKIKVYRMRYRALEDAKGMLIKIAGE